VEYDDVSHGLEPNNTDLINFIKLRSALPAIWEEQIDYIYLLVLKGFLNLRIEVFSSKIIYNFLHVRNTVLPTIQKERWCRDLNIQISINWGEVYKINFYSTIETD